MKQEKVKTTDRHQTIKKIPPHEIKKTENTEMTCLKVKPMGPKCMKYQYSSDEITTIVEFKLTYMRYEMKGEGV